MSQARDDFESMVRTELAPLLRSCGFAGSYREFRLREGDQEGVVQFQGSRRNRGTDYKFTVNLMIRDRTTGHTRTDHRLDHLTPARKDTWWTVVPGRPTLPLAQELAHAICDFGSVALRMDMSYPDSDEHVLDRRSPSEKRQWQMSRMRARAEMARGPSREALLAYLDSPDPAYRRSALWRFGLEFRDDAELRSILLRSISDDSLRDTAYTLLTRLDQLDEEIVETLRLALRDTSFFVRWQARYALTLHERRDVVAQEAHHARWPPTRPPILDARVQSIESLISSAGDGIDPRITSYTAAVERGEPHSTSLRHALPHGASQTLCRIPKDAVERISALFLLDDDRSCRECQAVARPARI